MMTAKKFAMRLERALNMHYKPKLFVTRLVDFEQTICIFRLKERRWGPFRFKRKIFLGEIDIEVSYEQKLNINNVGFRDFIDDIVLECFRHDLVWDDTPALKAAIKRWKNKNKLVPVPTPKTKTPEDPGFEIHGAL